MMFNDEVTRRKRSRIHESLKWSDDLHVPEKNQSIKNNLFQVMANPSAGKLITTDCEGNGVLAWWNKV